MNPNELVDLHEDLGQLKEHLEYLYYQKQKIEMNIQEVNKQMTSLAKLLK